MLPGAMSLGVRITGEKQPSPLQNKPLLQPKNLADGAESLQDMNYCRAADTFSLGPVLPSNQHLYTFFLNCHLFICILPLFSLLFERKNAGSCMLHFSLSRRKYFFLFPTDV